MSVTYNQHTYRSVFVGQTGHQHNRADKDDGFTPMAVDCEACEPYLVKEGWVYNPELVPLTDQQIREKDRVEREGNLAVKQAAQTLASVAADQVRAAAEPKQKRTVSPEQLAKMAEGRKAAAAAKSK